LLKLSEDYVTKGLLSARRIAAHNIWLDEIVLVNYWFPFKIWV